ncbi:MAG: asparagine synthase (glutamine-hydrolyzing) [Synergistaceae bacterium]|jgi:asparagine synthase (glutamine-hydrolysing)|nr:asparagine synthase (glutamine-hydrolyzing) [Synergistaceae bacterium]
MCGIAGFVNLDGRPASPVLLKKITDVIAHRGPDGEGQYVESNVGLGHRRLAIIDLSPAGNQPMSTPDGRYIVTYNGEIYNFVQLRADLQSKGYRFRSRTDTEVLLYAYDAWRERCVERFNGMFAFVIWDKKNGELFVARDRYGIKPLYYTFQSNTFVFASEQKAILAHPDIKKDFDLEGLLEYFTFQNFFTDKTLLKRIKLFPAGCHATLKQYEGAENLTFRQYWDFAFEEPEEDASEPEYIEELDRLFVQAVNRQLVSDVDVGSYLSGGMDSGSITAIAAKQLPFIKTFTCGFDLHSASGIELSFDEREKAEYMSYLFKTEHYEMVLKAGDMERVLPKLAWHLEEPRVGQSYPNYYAAQLAGKFVRVVLSGAGGDELLAGYPWRYYRAVGCKDFDDYIDKYYSFWQRLIPGELVGDIFKPIWGGIKHVSTKDIFRRVFKEPGKLTSPEEYVNHSLYFEAKTFLHGLLVIEDKISMAHGLETRVPFLDNDLVDFILRIPARFKLNKLSEVVRIDENEPGRKAEKYFRKTNDGKLIMRKAMRRHVPDDITGAIKQGFSAPDASWFKGDSIDYVRRVVNDDRAMIYDYMDKRTVKAMVSDHIEGRQNRRLFIWSLLNFEEYLHLLHNNYEEHLNS